MLILWKAPPLGAQIPSNSIKFSMISPFLAWWNYVKLVKNWRFSAQPLSGRCGTPCLDFVPPLLWWPKPPARPCREADVPGPMEGSGRIWWCGGDHTRPGKLWKITIFNRKTMGKPWENGDWYGQSASLIKVNRLFHWAIFNSKLVVITRGYMIKTYEYYMINVL